MTGLLSKLSKGVQQAAGSAPSAYSASNPPAYIYKILPHHTVNPRYALPPVPIPASFEFPVSELDAADGFLHFSTTLQLAGTLNRFFADDKAVTLVKCDYPRLSGFKVVKWEQAGSGGVYPHLYAQLEGENVEDVKELVREERGEGAEKASWDGALEKAEAEGWLV
ncbi:hypothetical protein BCR35DRAFT_288461 [Leucosporidium creatinivorum]|uniref:Uncharacterized protein n=1 Tax=Leucosporidium creatinivorum TaxID=106004 RepID=A0A1Y2G036_9BASI|nr:hypothetical protein BCR35DRAFT_288461 [Leucosporidium creatinivorum]